MKAFHVLLNDEAIDVVFYSEDYTAEEVRESLIGHDGYDPRIQVFENEEYE